MPNTIILSGIVNYPQEALAAEVLTPGHLVTFGTAGNAGKLIKHATANGNAAPLFVDVHPVPASGPTAPIDSTYPIGDNVKYFMPAPGALIYALVPASASAIVKGNFLTSNGDGTLKLHAGTETFSVVAIAAEAVNNSANTAGPVRIRVYAV